jgi:hypothetical protein
VKNILGMLTKVTKQGEKLTKQGEKVAKQGEKVLGL